MLRKLVTTFLWVWLLSAHQQSQAFNARTLPSVKLDRPGRVLFVAHFLTNTEVNQMLEMADELKTMGHESTFIVAATYSDNVRRRGYEPIETLDLNAKPELRAQWRASMELGITAPTWWEYFHRTFNDVFETNAQMYEPALIVIKDYLENNSKPDVMVASMFSDMAMDLAVKHDIPLAVNFACPLGGFFDYEANPTAPDPLLWGKAPAYQNFSYRLWKTVKFAKMMSGLVPLSFKINAIREKYDLAPVSNPMDMLNKAVFLVSWPLGLDYARRLRPLTVMTGFITSNWQQPAKLSDSDKELAKILDKHTDGVVFSGFGSLAVLTQEWFEAIVKGMSMWVAEQGPNAVGLMAVKLENRKGLDLSVVPDNVVLLEWTNQKMILAHANTKAFLTHGGQASVAEAVHNQVPMMAFPLFADQIANSEKVEEAGIGAMLFHRYESVTPEKVAAKLKYVTSEPSVTANLYRTYQISVRHGGAKTAAKAIEDMIVLGHLEHLVPIEEKSSFVANNNLDVKATLLALFAVIFLVGYSLLKFLIRMTPLAAKAKTD